MKQNFTFKRTLSALFLFMISTFVWADYDFKIDGIYYAIRNYTSVYVTSGDFPYTGSVDIPSTVSIDNKTFEVTNIGDEAFMECTSLTSVSIPNTVATIGTKAFYNCTSLVSIKNLDNVRTIGDYAFHGCFALTSIKLPNNLTAIGKSVFERCASLTSIEIPNGVTSIGDYAFYACTSITSIEIPNSVTNIGYQAFYLCKFTDVRFASVASMCRITYDWDSNPCRYAKNLYIDGELTTSIEIPSTITDIKDYAFDGCSSITSVKIPNSVRSIGKSAFCECSSLTSIDLPNSVNTIGETAFLDCPLTVIVLPESITSIGLYAFSGTSVKYVVCFAIRPPLGSSILFNVNTTGRTPLYVPASSVSDYKNIKSYDRDFTILPIDDDIIAGINNVEADETNASYYTLDGKRVDTPTQKGIYIQNGRKILIK